MAVIWRQCNSVCSATELSRIMNNMPVMHLTNKSVCIMYICNIITITIFGSLTALHMYRYNERRGVKRSWVGLKPAILKKGPEPGPTQPVRGPSVRPADLQCKHSFTLQHLRCCVLWLSTNNLIPWWQPFPVCLSVAHEQTQNSVVVCHYPSKIFSSQISRLIMVRFCRTSCCSVMTVTEATTCTV